LWRKKNVKKHVRASTSIVRDEQAFSLTEVCVAMGIAAVLMLALAEYSLSTARAQKSQSMSEEFTQTMGLVTETLGDENLCSSFLVPNNIPTISVVVTNPPTSIPSFSFIRPGGNPLTLFTVGTPFPSGLLISRMAITSVTSTGPNSPDGTLSQNMVTLEIDAQKTMPSTAPGAQSFVGNALYQKFYSVAVWADTVTNNITKCMSSKDMAQGAPVPTPSYSTIPNLTCTGNTPPCPSGAPAICSKDSATSANLSPVPYWCCPSDNWSC
jgi:type II secretory pathway pseudopilin PulG